jgi:hypothetical protein
LHQYPHKNILKAFPPFVKRHEDIDLVLAGGASDEMQLNRSEFAGDRFV